MTRIQMIMIMMLCSHSMNGMLPSKKQLFAFKSHQSKSLSPCFIPCPNLLPLGASH